MFHRGWGTARSRTPKRQTGVQKSKSEEESDCAGTSLRSAANHLTRLAVATISLRAPGLCRTIQTDRVVKRVPGLSFLESNAVAPGTVDSYRRAVGDFEAYATEIEQQLNWTRAVEVEEICTQGFGSEVGSRLLPAIRMMFPWCSHHGDLDMPRTVKALKGWPRLTPSSSQWPLKWTMVAAAMVTLWRRKKPVVAAAITLSYMAYLRPKELATRREQRALLVGQSRGEQRSIPSKTWTFDDSVILDRPDLLWMDRLWSALVANRPQNALLILVSLKWLTR